jgi:hypothetical protein
MKRELMSVGTVALATLLGACNTQDPERQCSVARAVSDASTGSFAATYTLKNEEPHPDRPCTQLKPEPLGLQKYFSQDPAAPDTVAIRTDRMGRLMSQYSSRIDAASDGKPYSVGPLASESPGPDNFCDVPELAPTRLDVSATATQPALSFGYAWSNLRIYNTPEIPGTQFVADLSYTELRHRRQARRDEVRSVPGLQRGAAARLGHQPDLPREVRPGGAHLRADG